MKLILVTDAGSVVGAVEEVDEYDLSKPMARAALLEEIADLIAEAQNGTWDFVNPPEEA